VHACLVEANRVESEAEIEEANGDAIEQAEGDDGSRVNWLWLKEVQPLGNVQREEGHHEVPARQRRRCIRPQNASSNKKSETLAKIFALGGIVKF